MALDDDRGGRRADWDHPFIDLVEPLASGAMGDVWRAYHRGLGADVAVKFLSGEMITRSDVRARFRNEARAAARIDERHVVRYYDFAETPEGHPFIVMECLRGVTLYDMLRERGRFEGVQVALVLEQLAAALDAVHRAGVIHRDVKPENVVLVPGTSELTVKLLDFGIAMDCRRGNARLTQPGLLIGTPSYMSPEQIERGHADVQSDLWALGVMTYELLTGVLPFQAPTLAALCLAIRERDCLTPSRRVRTLGPAVDAWFARATARDPSRRFASAREMYESFRRAVQCRHPVRPSQRPSRPSRPAAPPPLPAVRAPGAAGQTSLSPWALRPPPRSSRLRSVLGYVALGLLSGGMAAYGMTGRLPTEALWLDDHAVVALAPAATLAAVERLATLQMMCAP